MDPPGTWVCRHTACNAHWHQVDNALVCQCARRGCRRVIAVITTPPARPSPRALDALQNTSGQPATDWPGCID